MGTDRKLAETARCKERDGEMRAAEGAGRLASLGRPLGEVALELRSQKGLCLASGKRGHPAGGSLELGKLRAQARSEAPRMSGTAAGEESEPKLFSIPRRQTMQLPLRLSGFCF